MLNQTTITRNTPTMPTKVAFYNSLVSFYNSTMESGIKLNAEQKRAVRAVESFESGNIHFHYNYNVGAIDANVVKTLTPLHRRKANLYRILVAFFDASLVRATDTANVEESSEDKENLIVMLGVVINGNPKDMGVVVSLPCLTQIKNDAQVIEQKKNTPKKKYSVTVHAIYAFDTEVVASSRKEAEEIAFSQACESPDCYWEFVDYTDKGEVWNEKDI